MRNRWSSEVEHEVVKRAVMLLRSGQGMTRLQALQEAQKQVPVDLLPVARRKTKFFSHYRRKLENEISKLGSMPFDPKIESGPSIATSSPQDSPPQVPPQQITPPQDSLAQALATALDALAENIAERLRETIVEIARAGKPINGHAAKLPGDAPAAAEEQPPQQTLVRDFGNLPKKFHRPKVLIVGLRPKDHQWITGDMRHIDFRFLDARASSNAVTNLSIQCDATFTMTKFIGHKIENNIQGTFVRCPGGMTELKRLVMSRFPKETSIDQMRHH